MAKKAARPTRSDEDDDDDRPRGKSKNAKKPGMSTGLLVGLIAGGGFLLLLCLAGGGVGIWWVSKGGKGAGGGGGILGGGNSKEETIVLQAGEERSVRMTCETDKRMIVTVKSKFENPEAKFESWIPVQDTNMKRSKIASGQGPNIRMEFASTGFGDVNIKLKNHGPGSATCTVIHNGMR